VKHFFLVVLICSLLLYGLSQAAHACSIPVFRYALERWQPDRYVAVVFHDGELTKDQKSLLDRLVGLEGSQGVPANVEVAAVDTSQSFEDNEYLAALWKTHAEKAKLADGPWLVVRFPIESEFNEDVWSGTLTKDAVDAIRVSPVRTEIATRLLTGDSAVWLVIESGDKQADEKFVKRLSGDLKTIEKSLKLPELLLEDRKILSDNGPALKLRFSILRVSRSDTRERILLDSILYDDPDLSTEDRKLLTGPLAVPVFGRGRALAVMPATQLLPETLEDAARFLCGPCSCEVKQQNPGWDLLIAIDWDERISGRIVKMQTLPELTSPLSGVAIDDDHRDEVALLGTLTNRGFELRAGGYLTQPDESGIIRRFDPMDQLVETRRPGDDNYSLWKERVVDHASPATVPANVSSKMVNSPTVTATSAGHDQSSGPLVRNLTIALSAIVLLVIAAGVVMQLSRKPV